MIFFRGFFKFRFNLLQIIIIKTLSLTILSATRPASMEQHDSCTTGLLLALVANSILFDIFKTYLYFILYKSLYNKDTE